MNPQKLEKQSIDILNARIKDEYAAFYHYKAAENYCREVGYKFAADFFGKEATSEMEHAAKLQNYLVDWNVQPTLLSINAPIKFSSLVEIIEKSYIVEYKLYEAYEKDSAALMDANDICTFDFLGDLRKIQVESVAEYSDMLNQLELIDKNDKFQVYYLEERIFG